MINYLQTSKYIRTLKLFKICLQFSSENLNNHHWLSESCKTTNDSRHCLEFLLCTSLSIFVLSNFQRCTRTWRRCSATSCTSSRWWEVASLVTSSAFSIPCTLGLRESPRSTILSEWVSVTKVTARRRWSRRSFHVWVACDRCKGALVFHSFLWWNLYVDKTLQVLFSWSVYLQVWLKLIEICWKYISLCLTPNILAKCHDLENNWTEFMI